MVASLMYMSFFISAAQETICGGGSCKIKDGTVKEDINSEKYLLCVLHKMPQVAKYSLAVLHSYQPYFQLSTLEFWNHC